MTRTEPAPDPTTPDQSTPGDPVERSQVGADDASAHSTVSTELRHLRSLLG